MTILWCTYTGILFLPRHVLPSPCVPGIHVHSKLPFVLEQTAAFGLQSCNALVHSSISTSKRMEYLKFRHFPLDRDKFYLTNALRTYGIILRGIVAHVTLTVCWTFCSVFFAVRIGCTDWCIHRGTAVQAYINVKATAIIITAVTKDW